MSEEFRSLCERYVKVLSGDNISINTISSLYGEESVGEAEKKTCVDVALRKAALYKVYKVSGRNIFRGLSSGHFIWYSY